MQYLIRNVPKKVDAELRRRAKREKKSLNQVALEALAQATGVSPQPVTHHDLDHLFGVDPLEPEVISCLEDMRKEIDPEMWK